MSRSVLLQGDCVDLLRSVPDGSAQLIIADPPYNLGPSFGNDKEWLHSNDWLPWCREWLKQCERILSNDGSIFVYSIHHYVGFLQTLLYELGLNYRRQIIWNYENGWSRSTKTLATHYEPILWFSKSQRFTYHTIREPYKSVDRLKHPIRKGKLVWTPHPDGRLAGDVWKFPTLAGRRFRDERLDHPTQKPLALTDRIISHFSNVGDLVVIPFAGSGTECVSAVGLERSFWAAELNPEYVAMTLNRLTERYPSVAAGLAREA